MSRTLKHLGVCLQLGASCTTTTGPGVTHVVAAQPNTDKALWARAAGKHVVSPAWLVQSGGAAYKNWRCCT
jgi:twin BRCT domain